ncbi:hypothetical protein BC938DRAFT_477502 [Jimgerdemannia flammicorona]|uniref:Radical SAM core domain-containing protein n=1 Tax=Jimgerdemannia flammicorona TaxID=994334 RepID=A0A433QPA0_9FUNG|nr:hypothetical protein BC938DRAFT_477502 [Jimgerdemannia flammicorona]
MPKFRLALVALDWIRQKDPAVSLGHGSLLAMLQQNNANDCDMIDSRWAVNHHSDIRELSRNVLSQILPQRPDVWQLDASSGTRCTSSKSCMIFSDLAAIMAQRRRCCSVDRRCPMHPRERWRNVTQPLISLSAATEKRPCLSLPRSGQNQQSTVFHGRKFPKFAIKGLHEAGTFDKTLQADANLDLVPSPFLSDGNDIQPVIDLNRSFIRWETVRGCRFGCGFCQHRDAKSEPQHLNQGRIRREIEAICQSRFNDVAALDPTFNSLSSSYLSVLDQFANKFSGRITLQSRFEMVTPDFLDRCSRLGALGARIELEFGLQTIHPLEMIATNRSNSLRKIKRIAPELPSRSSATSLTRPSPVSAFAERLKPFEIAAYPLMLLRGTPMEQKKHELGLEEAVLSHVDPSIEELPKERIIEGIPHVVASPTFTREDWRTMNRMARVLQERQASVV